MFLLSKHDKVVVDFTYGSGSHSKCLLLQKKVVYVNDCDLSVFVCLKIMCKFSKCYRLFSLSLIRDLRIDFAVLDLGLSLFQVKCCKMLNISLVKNTRLILLNCKFFLNFGAKLLVYIYNDQFRDVVCNTLGCEFYLVSRFCLRPVQSEFVSNKFSKFVNVYFYIKILNI